MQSQNEGPYGLGQYQSASCEEGSSEQQIYSGDSYSNMQSRVMVQQPRMEVYGSETEREELAQPGNQLTFENPNMEGSAPQGTGESDN